ncbi:SH3 domain-containing protein [Pseudoruegeria sp. SK021]|uniref:SH3 domain-containing protein n=1 Tax=Pseudoruegeria sp. SK021 TaxID=1933035 RepID=UPI000A21A00C|nr:SH3 domain-containing protein [Pseudoruegeria sp. SK021]OSP56451.1 peptide-binding protein [Pseudoruegeria sp. SK021]
MRKPIVAALAVMLFAALPAAEPATAGGLGRFEVVGVDEDDMLKMRAGPGVGYIVIVGLPNGTVLQVQSCERTGATRWCRVSLDRARDLKGYVSAAYLKQM